MFAVLRSLRTGTLCETLTVGLAETGSVQALCDSLPQFLDRVASDIEGFLNVGLEHKLEPGQLLLAFPPFVIDSGPKGASLKACPAEEVIRFHADFALKIRNIPDGGQIKFEVTD
jgi:hypothetical protein